MGQRPTYVYYPTRALVSMFLDLAEGESVEVSIIGCTCMVGIGALDEPSFYRATVRSAGLAYRISVDILKSVANNCPAYLQGTNSATRRLLANMAQTVVCSKHHSIEQQIIRWLLTTLDYSSVSTIQITQQELADLLGFRREAVSLVIKKLQLRDEVRVRRGQLEVLNKLALEKASCDCYWIDRERNISLI